MKTIQMQNKWCLVLACMLICLGGCSTQASVTDVTLQNSAEQYRHSSQENTGRDRHSRFYFYRSDFRGDYSHVYGPGIDGCV